MFLLILTWWSSVGLIVVKNLALCVLGNLLVKRTRVPLSSWIAELCFADDAAIAEPMKDSIVKATVELDRVLLIDCHHP